jgi:hypothetical protein
LFRRFPVEVLLEPLRISLRGVRRELQPQPGSGSSSALLAVSIDQYVGFTGKNNLLLPISLERYAVNHW